MKMPSVHQCLMTILALTGLLFLPCQLVAEKSFAELLSFDHQGVTKAQFSLK